MTESRILEQKGNYVKLEHSRQVVLQHSHTAAYVVLLITKFTTH